MDLKTNQNPTNFEFLQLAAKFVVWVGASAGTISLLFTALGFLVEHAYFDNLGIPRTVYEATATEYTVAGAKFLMHVIPMTVLGAINFLTSFWWLALATIFTAILLWRLQLPATVRSLVFAALYGISLWKSLSFFETPSSVLNANQAEQAISSVQIIVFTTTVGMAYCWFEFVFRPSVSNMEDSTRGTLKRATAVPFLALLLCAVIAVPYLYGSYVLKRTYPTIEFIGKDKTFFCELLFGSADPQCQKGSGEPWELIDMGKERILLRSMTDGEIYIVPKGNVTSFRIRASTE